MEKEILSAEIFLQPVNTGAATADLDAELSKVETALKAFTPTVSMYDYAVAVISGILSGVTDALVVKELDPTLLNRNAFSGQLKDIANKVLKYNPESDKPVGPVMNKAVEEGLPDLLPHLEKMAAKAAPMGLLSSVVVQLARGGLLQHKDKNLNIIPEDMSGSDGTTLVIAGIFTGILKWLQSISAASGTHGQNKFQFQLLDKLCGLIRSAPGFSEVVEGIEKWQRQLPNELRSRKAQDKGMGVERTFYSFFLMLAGVPVFASTKLAAVMKQFQAGKQIGLNEVPILKSLNRQALPVLMNEIIVRSLFFVSRLARELAGKDSISQISWEAVLPFGNRDIDRLMAISSMTLSVADTIDAAVHAAVDSCGNGLLFATRFVTRFNYIAAGRAALAVVKEVSNEQAEAQLIHMKRILTQAKTTKALEILAEYQEQLETRVCEYLAGDITVFLNGLAVMDQGLSDGNSDLVIRGNVMIQKVLGKTPQFADQQEFDELMDSDMPLIL